jgi:hypothetical protein
MRRENEKSIGQVLEKLFEQSHLDDGLWEVRIQDLWSREMPEMVRTRTSKLSFSAGKLIVRLNSSTLRFEFSHSLNELRQKLNAGLDKEVIREIELH